MIDEEFLRRTFPDDDQRRKIRKSLIEHRDLPHRQIRFTCTDSGTHPSREIVVLTRFYDMILTPSDALQPIESRAGRGGRSVRARQNAWSEGKGQVFADELYTLKCPTCRRTVQWKTDRAKRIVDTLIEAGRTSVDLSALPANLA